MNSIMTAEAHSIAEVLEHSLATYPEIDSLISNELRQDGGRLITLGRGSSGVVGDFLSYLSTARYGNLSQRLPLSLVTAYEAPLTMKGHVVLAVSQSGASPDLVKTLRYCREKGAKTIAIVNVTGSPLAAAADYCVEVGAGPELSVAATKSFIASLVAGIALVAAWHKDAELHAGLKELPDQLRGVRTFDWTPHIAPFIDTTHMMVVSRGYGFPVAVESALKLKETCGIQAEAYSSAEARHGPMTLITQNYPLLVLVPPGPCQDELLAFGWEMRTRGAHVLLVGTEAAQSQVDVALPYSSLDELAPLCLMQAMYFFAAQLAQARGRNPDKPAYLSKVTLTH